MRWNRWPWGTGNPEGVESTSPLLSYVTIHFSYSFHLSTNCFRYSTTSSRSWPSTYMPFLPTITPLQIPEPTLSSLNWDWSLFCIQLCLDFWCCNIINNILCLNVAIFCNRQKVFLDIEGKIFIIQDWYRVLPIAMGGQFAGGEILVNVGANISCSPWSILNTCPHQFCNDQRGFMPCMWELRVQIQVQYAHHCCDSASKDYIQLWIVSFHSKLCPRSLKGWEILEVQAIQCRVGSWLWGCICRSLRALPLLKLCKQLMNMLSMLFSDSSEFTVSNWIWGIWTGILLEFHTFLL